MIYNKPSHTYTHTYCTVYSTCTTSINMHIVFVFQLSAVSLFYMQLVKLTHSHFLLYTVTNKPFVWLSSPCTLYVVCHLNNNNICTYTCIHTQNHACTCENSIINTDNLKKCFIQFYFDCKHAYKEDWHINALCNI